MVLSRRADLGEADRRARHGKRTRTLCRYGLPYVQDRRSSRPRWRRRRGPSAVAAPARGSTMSSDCADLHPADPLCGRRTKPRSAQPRGRHNRRSRSSGRRANERKVSLDMGGSAYLTKRAGNAQIEESAMSYADIATSRFDLILKISVARAATIQPAPHNVIGTDFSPR